MNPLFFSFLINFIRESFFAKSSKIFREPSIEQSSIIMNSKSEKVCFKIDSTLSFKYFSALYTDIIIEIITEFSLLNSINK